MQGIYDGKTNDPNALLTSDEETQIAHLEGAVYGTL